MAAIESPSVFWNLEESGSGARADAVGSNDLTANGAVSSDTAGSPTGKRYLVLPNSAYLSRADSAGVSAGSQRTFAGFVRFDDLGSAGAERVIVSKYNSGGNDREYYLSYINGTGWKFLYNAGTGGGGDSENLTIWNAYALVEANWYFFVLRFDMSEQLVYFRLADVTAGEDYFRGKGQRTKTGFISIRNGGSDFLMGRANFSTDRDLRGALAQVGIWPAVIDELEIEWFYRGAA